MNRLHYGNKKDFVKLTELDIVAFQPHLGISFSKIDFEDFLVSNNSADVMILNLNLKNMIDHTFPKIDRCCKLNNRKVEYDYIDNMKRIDCHISKDIFTAKYVNQRQAVILKGCQTEWKAKNWTFENLLNRYNNITIDENEHYHFLGKHGTTKPLMNHLSMKSLHQVKLKISSMTAILSKYFNNYQKD